jgi:hypothetical protein
LRGNALEKVHGPDQPRPLAMVEKDLCSDGDKVLPFMVQEKRVRK